MNTARLNHRTSFLGRVHVVPHAGATSLLAWGQDVSETGMFLQTTQPFAAGDSVTIRFEVDGLEVHVRAATVVWVRTFESVNVDGKSPGIGIRFVSIDPPARSALRRLTSVKVANDVPADSALPAPKLTLPPLSRSIIQAAGGRDLDDTQDLLPPSSLPRHTGEAISLPPLQFTMPPTLVPALSYDHDVNLTSESRVFDGVPAAPRPITILPRLRSLPPTKVPMLSMTTSIVIASAVLNSKPPVNAAITQPMHSLPPIDAVDVFAGWTFAKVQPVVAATSAVPSIDDDAVTTPPVAVDVLAAQELQARFSSELLDELDDDAPDNATIINPSTLEAQTVPPANTSTVSSSISVIEDSFNDGGFFADEQKDDSLGVGTVDDRGAYSLGAVATSTPPVQSATREVSLTDERRTDRCDRRTPKPHTSKSSSSSRSSMQVAVVLLVAGCAAGGAVGVMSRAARAKPATSTSTSTSVTAAAVAPAMPAVMNVADAEAELYGKKLKAPASPIPAPKVAVVDEMPAPATVAVAVAEALKVESKPEPVKLAAAPKVGAPKVEAVHTSLAKPVAKAPLVTKPGRLELDLPEGGRVKKVFALAGPARVVVDFERAKLPAQTVELGEAGALELRFGKPDASTQRVVIVLEGDNKPDAVAARLEGDRLVATWHR